MKKKKEPTISEVSIYEEDAWYVSYIGTDGKKKVTKLDAETREDALFEASHLLDVRESEIQD